MSEQEQPQEETKQPKLVFGFGVFVTEDGNVILERNTEIFRVPVERESSLIEIRRYLSEILMDLQAQASAEYTVLKMASPKADPVMPTEIRTSDVE